MARKPDPSGQIARQLAAAFMKLPWKARVGIVAVVLVAAGVFYLATRHQQANPPEGPPSAVLPGGARNVVFCSWNMENLFDDREDRRRVPDRDYDDWFASNPADRELKYRRLAETLVRMNAGGGPDIIVGIEIESPRAADLLKDALNAALPAGAAKYAYVAMKDLDAGRHIAPCVISRFPLGGDRLRGHRQRILETHVTVNDHDLCLIASHWTSQLTDKGGEDGGRAKYAATIYELYTEAFRANPDVDLLVCGDFNDTPESDPVANALHLTGDASAVTTGANPPRLFGPLSGKDPNQFGTHYYSGPLIYDQIGLSPGMLDDAGWGYVTDSVRVPTDGLIRSGARTRRPWRFGSRHDDAVGRGYSDHFPVVVTLKVAP